MPGLVSAIALVVARFGALEIDGQPLRVTTEPTAVNPPCVFVPLPDMAFTFAKQRADITWTAYLVGPNSPPQRTTTNVLAEMVDAVAGLFPFQTGDLYTLTLPGGGPPAQAYRLQWPGTITIGAGPNGR